MTECYGCSVGVGVVSYYYGVTYAGVDDVASSGSNGGYDTGYSVGVVRV